MPPHHPLGSISRVSTLLRALTTQAPKNKFTNILHLSLRLASLSDRVLAAQTGTAQVGLFLATVSPRPRKAAVPKGPAFCFSLHTRKAVDKGEEAAGAEEQSEVRSAT